MIEKRIPLWLKIGFSVWVAVWAALYWKHYGPKNFIWFCDIGNFLIAAALWRESRLLFSMQATALLIIQSVWTLDFLARLVSGHHLIGGTEYMFDAKISLGWRALSLFHVAMPFLLIYGVKRLGYDRRGWLVQTAFGSIVLVISRLICTEKENLNWVWGPFSRPQFWMNPWLYLLVCIAAYPAILYFPTHLLLDRLFGRRPAPK